MRVLLIPDCWGWAYDFYARGVKAYSEHDVTICPGYPKEDLTLDLIDDHDVVFCFSRTIWNAFKPEIREAVGDKPNAMWCCGLSFTNPPPEIDVYAVCTTRLMRKAVELGIGSPVLLREGVDTDVFTPATKITSDRLRVGWAGNPNMKLKRFYLLQKLKYPVKVMTDHDKKYRVKTRTRKPMVDFYSGLDVYITVTKEAGGHGVGRTVLEAMAMGIPVIATDVHSRREVVQPEWLVSDVSDNAVISEIDRRLTMLDEDRGLLKKVGYQNRSIILEEYSWKTRIDDWDQLFKEVCER